MASRPYLPFLVSTRVPAYTGDRLWTRFWEVDNSRSTPFRGAAASALQARERRDQRVDLEGHVGVGQRAVLADAVEPVVDAGFDRLNDIHYVAPIGVASVRLACIGIGHDQIDRRGDDPEIAIAVGNVGDEVDGVAFVQLNGRLASDDDLDRPARDDQILFRPGRMRFRALEVIGRDGEMVELDRAPAVVRIERARNESAAGRIRPIAVRSCE